MLKIIGLFCIILVVIISITFFRSASETLPFSLTSESPNKTYTVHLAEQLGKNGDHRVRMNVSKLGRVIINDEPLYGGSKWDGRFYGLYPKHNWITDSIIHFGHEDPYPTVEDDVLEVANKSSTTFSYFLVNTGRENMYLIYDFQPRSSVTLYTEPQNGTMADFSEFSYRGRFADGRTLGNGFASFDIKGKYKLPARYTIVVDDSGVSVSSNEFSPLKKSN